MEYIVPDEMSGFLVGVRKRHTLAGFDPRTSLWAPPGGGMKDFKKPALKGRTKENLVQAALRETGEECGKKLKFVVGHPRPEIFYIHKLNHAVLSWQEALANRGNVKLHAYFLMIEITKEKPEEREPAKFRSPAFHGEKFFATAHLRPSFRHALNLFGVRRDWPVVTPSNRLEEFDLAGMQNALHDMHLHPDFIDEVAPLLAA